MGSQFDETGPQAGYKGCSNCTHRGPSGWEPNGACRTCTGYHGGYPNWKADQKTLAGYIEAIQRSEGIVKDDPECRLGDIDLNVTPVPSGSKFDSGKPQYSLIPPNALEDVVKVLTFGAQKYSRDNWKSVPDANNRYFDAAMRHLWAYKKGDPLDEETGCKHLSHAICCLLFMSEGFH